MTAESTHIGPALNSSTNQIREPQVLREQEAVTKSKAHMVANSGSAVASVPAGSYWPDGLVGYAHVLGLSLEGPAVSSF